MKHLNLSVTLTVLFIKVTVTGQNVHIFLKFLQAYWKRIAFLTHYGLLFPVALSAQEERTSHTLPVISDTALWTLQSASGWMKNFEGQWIEGKNKIQKSFMSVNDKDQWEIGINATGKDNFSKLELRRIKVSGEELLILLKTMQDGDYKFPALEKSWKPAARIKFYVVKEQDTPAEAHDEKSDYKTYRMKLYFCGMVDNNAEALATIATRIGAQDATDPRFRKQGSTSTLLLYYADLQDGKHCRFFIRTLNMEQRFDTYPVMSQAEYTSYKISPPDSYYYEAPRQHLAGFIQLIAAKK